MVMPERCPICNQKYEIEIGFWFGTGYVSYAMSVGLMIALAVLFALIVGFSYKNNSIYTFIGCMIGILIMIQPWIMRYSRVLYIYVFIKYGSNKLTKD
jgi:phosphoglycerol transferase MdoB-like AlkP superfamily enzyme